MLKGLPVRSVSPSPSYCHTYTISKLRCTNNKLNTVYFSSKLGSQAQYECRYVKSISSREIQQLTYMIDQSLPAKTQSNQAPVETPKAQPWKKLFQVTAQPDHDTPSGESTDSEEPCSPWKGWKPDPNFPDEKPWYQWRNNKKFNTSGSKDTLTLSIEERGRGSRLPTRKRSSSTTATVAEGG